MTNYDHVARSGQYAQRYESGRYARTAQRIDAFVGEAERVLELGCGTGRWLSQLAGRVVVGIDPSFGMLADARLQASMAELVRARAEALPFADGSFDRALIVNALHHFANPAAVLRALPRVLGAGGVLIVGLDPSVGSDRWPVYDYFENTLARDRARFPSITTLRAWLAEAGFGGINTEVAETFVESIDARAALCSGALGRHTTSQLTDLSDADYAGGIARIETAAEVTEKRGEALVLQTHLTLYATVGWLG